jgi:hypothetical protein
MRTKSNKRKPTGYTRMTMKTLVALCFMLAAGSTLWGGEGTRPGPGQPRSGLEFLAGIAEFQDLRLKMTEEDLQEVLKKHKLRTRLNKSKDGKVNDYHLYTATGEHVIVMFRGGKCSGIQRMRPEPVTVLRLPDALPPSSADARSSKVFFGPDVQRTLRIAPGADASVFFLDIEKGEIKTCPFPVGVPPTGGRMFDGLSGEALKRQPDLAKWIVESGVDVAFVLRRKDWGMIGMVKPGFTVDSNTSGPNTDLNAGTACLAGQRDDLAWAEIQPPPLSGGWPVSKCHSYELRVSGSLHGSGYPPRNGYHWIHTASGSLAVLQLGGLGDAVPGLEIRYRIVQGAQAKAAAESKAREALKRPQATVQAATRPGKSPKKP